MERLISVGGLLLMVGIAWLFSTNKKAIKPRVILWGLGLQLIFAMIILTQNFLSFLGMFIFVSLIILYMFEKQLEKAVKSKILSGVIVVVISALVVAAFYFVDGSRVIRPIKRGGNYVVEANYVLYPQEGTAVEKYNEVLFTYFAPEGEALEYAFGYDSDGKQYVNINDEILGPFDEVVDIYPTRDGSEWLVTVLESPVMEENVESDVDLEAQIEELTGAELEETENIEEAAESVVMDKYYILGDTVYGPYDEEHSLLYSAEGEAWGEMADDMDNFYVQLDDENLGMFTSQRPHRLGGINYWILLAIGIFLVVMAILKKKSEKFKDSHLGKFGFAAFLLVSIGTLWSRGIYGARVMAFFTEQIEQFLSLTNLGTEFLFQGLSNIDFISKYGGNFAIAVLPTIIFFSAFMAILYHFGIIQVVVSAMAKFMRWTMGTSGSETLSVSSNIFVGQTEAPLLVKPYLEDMTKSELHAIMVGGFATIAGGVLAGYISMGIDAGHLIAASVMSAPAALMIAKVLFPETEHSKTAGDVAMPKVKAGDNVLGAAAQGVTDGLNLALNVAAMLLAFIALIGLIDLVLGFFDKMIDYRLLGGALIEGSTEYKGIFPGSLKSLFGFIFRPIAFMLGAPWAESADVGFLLGTKIAVNEFVAYGALAKMIASGTLGTRAIVVGTYALCGFANFSSIGIQIGGIGALVPNRRGELSGLALRAMFGGALASWTTAAIAATLL